MYIVSNCQKGYIEIFLNLYKLNDIFLDFECWGNTKKSKSDNIDIGIEEAKANCKDIGFKEGTEKFGECVLELTK